MSDKQKVFKVRTGDYLNVRSFQIVAQAKLQGFPTWDEEEEHPTEEYVMLRLTYVIEDREKMPINTPYLERIEIYE